MLSLWYPTRLSWNHTYENGEEERVFLAGGSLVATPSFTYGRTKYAAWGCTALNPDVMDLYIEELNDAKSKYAIKNGTDWAEVETKVEQINVRFGSTIDFEIKFTRNGVILPTDLI